MRESDIQTAVMDMLGFHPKVAWAMVTTSGTIRGKGGGRYFHVGFPGLSDILFQTRSGRLGALEIKKPGQLPTKEQLAFLSLVESNGGIAGWADSVEMAKRILE